MAILDLIDRHESRLLETINLVASENLVSGALKRALASDMSARYCIPPPEERDPAIWDYPNQGWVRAVAAETEALARKVFQAAYVDVRPLSGTQVAQIILTTLVSPGDTVWSIAADCGGHFATRVIAQQRGLRLLPIPYDRTKGIIDIDAASLLARQHPPRLVFLDASMQLFPHPLALLREALGTDVILSYDASHTMGLIAGGQFQSPFAEGADLLHGSTHKSLWGPQKGLIACRGDGEVAEKIRNAVVPAFVSNVHTHHVAALGVALEEMVKYGKEYASEVVANAKELAAKLSEAGLDVLFWERGGTESHQILLHLGEAEATQEIWQRLESVGLNTNAVSLPFRGGYGLRLGAAEATRRGMGRAQMAQIAECIGDCVLATRTLAQIRSRVHDISACHRDLLYAD